MKPIRTFLISPYAGKVRRNRRYLLMAMRHSIGKHEAPFASHELYTRALDDNNPRQREKGIILGQVWMRHCQQAVVYQDLGFSKGMQADIKACHNAGIPVYYRSIGKPFYISPATKSACFLFGAILGFFLILLFFKYHNAL